MLTSSVTNHRLYNTQGSTKHQCSARRSEFLLMFSFANEPRTQVTLGIFT